MTERAPAANADYEIVRYRPEFKEGLLELQSNLWGSDVDINRAYFNWKFEHNPYIDVPLIHLVLHDGQPVGMRGNYGAKWQIGDQHQEFLVPCGGDLVVSPEHRNRGLAQMMFKVAGEDLADSGYEYLFALGGNPVAYPISTAAGARPAVRLDTAYRRSPRETIRRSLFRGCLSAPLVWRLFPAHRGEAIFSRLDGGARSASACTVERVPRCTEMAKLVQRLGYDGRIRHVRNAQYFAWRYRNPFSTYRFVCWGEAQLDGYLVLQAPAHVKARVVSIVDWEAPSARVRENLLRVVVERGGFEEVTIWTETLAPDSLALLRQVGFTCPEPAEQMRRRRQPDLSVQRVAVRSLRKIDPQTDWELGGRNVLDAAQWDMRMLYSDDY